MHKGEVQGLQGPPSYVSGPMTRACLPDAVGRVMRNDHHNRNDNLNGPWSAWCGMRVAWEQLVGSQMDQEWFESGLGARSLEP